MKLYKSIILTLVVGTLTGCGAMMDSVALYHDRQDPCQGENATPERKAELGRPDNYKRPDWCFASSGYRRPVRITGPDGRTMGYIR